MFFLIFPDGKNTELGTLNYNTYRQKVSIKIDALFQNLLDKTFSAKLTAKWREMRMQLLLAEMEEQARYLESKEG